MVIATMKAPKWGGRTQINKRSTYARPGMHMQQCSAVPIIVLSFSDRYVHVLGHMLCYGCRVLSTTKGSLHSTTGAASVFRLTLGGGGGLGEGVLGVAMDGGRLAVFPGGERLSGTSEQFGMWPRCDPAVRTVPCPNRG